MNKICTQEQFDLIDQWYHEHPSAKSIAKKYRDKIGIMSGVTITKYLKANGYKTYSRGEKPQLSDDAKKLMMLAKFKHDKDEIDLSLYSDYEKISLLSKRFSVFRWKYDIQFSRVQFFERFYHDQQYNDVFDQWRNNQHHKLLTPSIDHITPSSCGGLTTLDNLQWLPIWENKAKSNCTQEEWITFKERFVT